MSWNCCFIFNSNGNECFPTVGTSVSEVCTVQGANRSFLIVMRNGLVWKIVGRSLLGAWVASRS